MKIVFRLSLLIVGGMIYSAHAYSYHATNFSRPMDALWDSENWAANEAVRPLKFGIQLEGGSTRHSLNSDSKRVGLFEEYQPTQSALAMLQGYGDEDPQTSLLAQLNLPVDDGVRGNFKVSGRFKQLDYTLFGRLNFQLKSVPGYFDVTAFVPVRDINISDVTWNDQTQGITAEDILVKTDLTSQLADKVNLLGDLNIGSWHKRGLGDVALQMRWHKTFSQLRRYLKYVRITARAGATIPTGAMKNEEIVVSVPFGNDGAFGLPVGGSLDLWFKYALRFGVDVDYMKLLDTTAERRVKKDTSQTDLLLLSKGSVRKKYGPYWTFNVHGGIQHFFRGLSAMMAYEYKMHSEDKLFSQSNELDQRIINSAETLKEWTTHSIILQTSYDCFMDFKNFFIKPQMMFFCKIPLPDCGRRSVMPLTIGGEFTFNF